MSNPAPPRPRVVILNAALNGASGNTAAALASVHALLALRADASTVILADGFRFVDLRPGLEAADAFVIGAGTHWDSWTSHWQRFLEEATPAEGTSLWLGKPAACVVTEHSVGGKGVLSRLQGVLTTLGCQIPPMSGLVLARAALAAAKNDEAVACDCWSEHDLAVIAHNLLCATAGRRDWQTWPVDRGDLTTRWLRSGPDSVLPPGRSTRRGTGVARVAEVEIKPKRRAKSGGADRRAY